MSSRGFTITQVIRQERRKRAEERQAEYDKLTLQQKLDRLPPDGAKKQRARLLKAIEDQQKKAATAAQVTPKPEASDSNKKPYQKKSKS